MPTQTITNESPKKANLDNLTDQEWRILQKADAKTFGLLKDTIANDPINNTYQVIESLHSEMRRQFSSMYIAQRPTLREIQAQEKAEAIEKIKNILFAKVLVRMIKNHSLAGNQYPLTIDLQALLEAL